MIDLKKVKADLEKQLRELDERAHEIDEDLSETPDRNWSEQAIEAEDDEVLEEVGAITLIEIGQIKTALAKIEDGTYGVCDGCGEDIPEKRLEALPYASRCIKCA